MLTQDRGTRCEGSRGRGRHDVGVGQGLIPGQVGMHTSGKHHVAASHPEIVHTRSRFVAPTPAATGDPKPHKRPRIGEHDQQASSSSLTMWIPNSIYQKLPAIYAAAGVALLPAFGISGPSVISAAMLVAAGVLTALWRYKHRAAVEAESTLSPKDEWAQRRERRLEEARLRGY